MTGLGKKTDNSFFTKQLLLLHGRLGSSAFCMMLASCLLLADMLYVQRDLSLLFL